MRRPLTVAPLLALLIACAADDGSDATATVPTWTLGEPSFSVGGMTEDPVYQLFGAVDATRLSDGRVAILNTGSSQVRFYGPDGRHLMDVGREGDGPGEFRYIRQIDRLPGDTLLVTSRDPGFTWIGPDGGLARTQRFNPFAVRIPCRISEGGTVTLPTGMIGTRFDDNFYGPDCPPGPSAVYRQSALLTIVDPMAETWDSIAVLGGTERNANMYRVFGHDALLAWTADAVYAHDTATDVITKFGLDGDTLAVLSRPFESRPVPPEATRVEGPGELTSSTGETLDMPDYEYPERLPAVARIVASTDGRLWVMAYPEVTEPTFTVRLHSSFSRAGPAAGAHWRVLDEADGVIAEIRTPPGLFVMEVGPDYVLGLERDEFDVETIVVYPIQRGAAS